MATRAGMVFSLGVRFGHTLAIDGSGDGKVREAPYDAGNLGRTKMMDCCEPTNVVLFTRCGHLTGGGRSSQTTNTVPKLWSRAARHRHPKA